MLFIHAADDPESASITREMFLTAPAPGQAVDCAWKLCESAGRRKTRIQIGWSKKYFSNRLCAVVPLPLALPANPR